MIADLRQALDHFDASEVDYEPYVALETVLDAARCWLRLQEGDEQLVEKVALALRDYMRSLSPDFATEWEFNMERARAVLAAITGEET